MKNKPKSAAFSSRFVTRFSGHGEVNKAHRSPSGKMSQAAMKKSPGTRPTCSARKRPEVALEYLRNNLMSAEEATERYDARLKGCFDSVVVSDKVIQIHNPEFQDCIREADRAVYTNSKQRDRARRVAVEELKGLGIPLGNERHVIIPGKLRISGMIMNLPEYRSPENVRENKRGRVQPHAPDLGNGM